MSFSPISFIASNYRDYATHWIKAYEPGTTTPKSMATDSSLSVLISKAEINVDGFIVSAGAALIIPYIDGAYDLWLFPTEAEADTNDTSNALRVADNVTGVGSSAITADIINDLSQAYIFDTVALMQASTIVFPDGKRLEWLGYYSVGDGGGNSGIVTTGAHTDDGGSIFTLADGKYVQANIVGHKISVLKFGAKGDGSADDIIPIGNTVAFAGVDRLVWFPNTGSNYRYSAPTRLSSSFKLDGDNVTLQPLTPFTPYSVADQFDGGNNRDLTHCFIFLRNADNSNPKINVTGGARKEKAFLGRGIRVDGFSGTANESEGAVLVERMPYSRFDCESVNVAVNVENTVECWGVEYTQQVCRDFTDTGIRLGFASNGVAIRTPRIWGENETPPTGISVHENSNGISVLGGFIEKVGTGIDINGRVGPVNIDSVDFEVITDHCVKAKGDLSSPTGRLVGPVSVNSSYIDGTTSATFQADNSTIRVIGNRIRGAINFETLNQGVIIEEDNEKEQGDGIVAGSRVFSLNRRTKYDMKNYIPRRSGSWLEEYSVGNYQYNDDPTFRSSGLNFSSSYQGGATDRYLAEAEWFITEMRNGVQFRRIGVKLNNRAGQFAFSPTDIDGGMSLGESDHRWKEIHAVLQTFADDAAASSLSAGQVYKTATGELRIKL